MTAESDCQDQEARREAEIGPWELCQAVKTSGEFREKKVVIAVSEIMHLRNERIVLNEGVPVKGNEIARI